MITINIFKSSIRKRSEKEFVESEYKIWAYTSALASCDKWSHTHLALSRTLAHQREMSNMLRRIL